LSSSIFSSSKFIGGETILYGSVGVSLIGAPGIPFSTINYYIFKTFGNYNNSIID